jgi:putative Ca2+/H+ antiporter (TMEM165/GDT1 family)
MNLSIIALVFGVVFIAELPDKSMFASLALSSRYKKSWVWMGVAAAFFVHVTIAVTAGHFLRLLPRRPLKIAIGLLFLLGAGLLLFGNDEDESEEQAKLVKEQVSGKRIAPSFRKVFLTSFAVVFVGEWGDITQIVTANYAAKYHSILNVGLGALLGLWSVAALGIFLGQRLLAKVPGRTVQRATAVILLVFAVVSLSEGIK